MAERGRVRRGEVPQPHHLPGRHGHHSKASLCNKNISTSDMWLCRHRDYSSGQIQLKWWQGKAFQVEIGRISIQSFQNWKISVCEDFNGTWDRRQAARPPRRNRNFSNYFDGFSFSLDSGTTAGYEDVFLLKLIQCSIILCDFPVLFRVFFLPRVFTDYVISFLTLLLILRRYTQSFWLYYWLLFEEKEMDS